jgi:NADH/NAD ratio-sensing transcriptional regulator Rex
VWIKGDRIKGLVWDLAVVGVKNFGHKHILELKNRKECEANINKLYEIAIDKIFGKKSPGFYNVPLEN